MNQGWECPKCGACYSPRKSRCSECGPKKQVQPPPVPMPGVYETHIGKFEIRGYRHSVGIRLAGESKTYYFTTEYIEQALMRIYENRLESDLPDGLR